MCTIYPGLVHVFLRLVAKDGLSDLEDLIDEDSVYSFQSLLNDICKNLSEVFTGDGCVHGDTKVQVSKGQYGALRDQLSYT